MKILKSLMLLAFTFGFSSRISKAQSSPSPIINFVETARLPFPLE